MRTHDMPALLMETIKLFEFEGECFHSLRQLHLIVGPRASKTGLPQIRVLKTQIQMLKRPDPRIP